MALIQSASVIGAFTVSSFNNTCQINKLTQVLTQKVLFEDNIS